METIRCGKCNRKLGEAEYTRIAIKCPRCGALNLMTAQRRPNERLGASPQKEMPHETPKTSNH